MQFFLEHRIPICRLLWNDLQNIPVFNDFSIFVKSKDIHPSIVVNSARAGRELVRAGHGIAFLPSFAIADDINKGQIKRLLPDYVSEPIGIYAVYQHRKHLSAKTRLFIEAMNEYFKLNAYRAF